MSREQFRILLVEDNPGDARLLHETFRDATDLEVDLSHEVTLSAGLRRACAEKFDILMLDLSLPDEEGLETVVRAHATVPKIPIIVLTGNDDAELAARAVREGAQDYLVKGQVTSQLLSRAMRYASERKRATAELRRSEQYFRSLIENATDVIMVVDSQGRITYSSPSLGRLLGYNGIPPGTRVQELVHPEDLGLLHEMSRLGWAQPGPTPAFESRWRHANGSWLVLEGMGQQLHLGDKQGGIVFNSRDVTERKQAEASLRELNETLRAVIETSPLAIVLVDLAGRIRNWNAAAEWVFGYSSAEAIGRSLEEIAPDCAAYLKEAQDRRLVAGSAGTEARFTRRNGGAVDVSVWHTKLWHGDGKATGSLLLVADNTDRRRLEEQFRQSQKMEAVGRLAGGVAHDFNNLLTVITGYCELLLDQLPQADSMSEDLTQVQRAAERGAALTRQLLAFSRQQITQPRVIQIMPLMEEMRHIFRRILGESVELKIDIPPGAGKVRIDPGQIEQVLVNMVVNARDAMPQGGKVTIEASNVELDEELARMHTGLTPGPYVMLAVSDTGVGMSTETRERLFEPFFTTKERGQGTGLGLSTSYGIVRQNRGSIAVYSELGRGSVFKIYLPRVFEAADADVRSVKEPSLYRGSETVLVVEDEEGVRRVVRGMLEQYGYKVVVAPTGGDALRLAESDQCIDLLITDVIMPNMSGRELADRMSSQRPEVKILFVSGYTDSAIIHHGVLEAGVHFLQKPFTPEQLARKVREVLDRRPA